MVAARLVSRVGGEAAFFVGLWGKAAYELDATTWQMTGLMAALAVASLVGSAIAGVFVDRFDPRRVLIGAEVLFVPATLALITADSMAQLIPLAALFGVVSAPTFTAISSFAPYLTDDEQRLASINSAIESAGMAAVFLGPAAGALVVGWWSVDAVFVLDAVTSVIAVILVLTVVMRDVERTESTSFVAEARAGLAFTYGHPALRYFVLGTTAIWLVFGAFSVLEPFFFRDVLGASLETLGWVASLFGVGLFAGSYVLPRLPATLVSARGMAAVLAVNGLGAFLYAATDSIVIVAIGGIVWGFLIGLFAPIVRTLLHLHSPDPLIGRISSVNQMHAEVAHLLPLLAVPVLVATFDVRPVMLATGWFLVVAGLVFFRAGANVDRAFPTHVEVGDLERIHPSDEPISPNP